MCTPRESRMFIEAVESIPTREMPHFTHFTLDFDETDFSDEFPVKDRSKSRKRHHASKRDKAKHYNRKSNQFLRDWRLYESGFNYNQGKSHNQDSLEYLTSLDMELYNADSNKGNKTSDPTDTDKEQLANCFLSVMFPDSNPHIASGKLLLEIKTLYNNGIEISNEIIKELFSNLSRRQRKFEIDNERPIVAYSAYGYDFYGHNFPDDFYLGTYPTMEMAEKVLESLNKSPEYGQDYYVLPVRTYTEEQTKEIKSLGFLPVVGFVEA